MAVESIEGNTTRNDPLSARSRSDSDGRAQASREATEHQRRLNTAVAELEAATDDAARRRCLTIIKENSNGFSLSLAALTGSNPLEEQSKKAEEVFGVPELLESILLYLSVRDLLAAKQVSKTVAAIVEASPKLQILLGFRARNTNHFSMPLLNHLDLRDCGQPSNYGEEECRRKHYNPITYFCEFDYQSKQAIVYFGLSMDEDGKLPRIGKEARRIRLCNNPPITMMRTEIECCYFETENEVQNQNGITVGDLYDYAERMVAKHLLCPAASSRHLNDKGFVKLCFDFHGRVDLDRDEPILSRGYVSDRSRRRYEMEAYTTAKLVAHKDGKPIPTLAEWEASSRAIAKRPKRKGLENGTGDSA